MALSGRQLPLILFPFGSGGVGGLYGAGLPVAMGVTFTFFGVVAVVLGAGALPFVRRDRWMLVALLLTAVVLVASLSPIIPPLGKLIWRIPVFSHFRAWGRYNIAGRLLIALLAGFVVGRLHVASETERRTILRWSCTTAGLYIAAAGAFAAVPALGLRSLPGLALPALLAALTIGLLFLLVRRPRLGTLALVVLVFVEVVIVHRPILGVPTVSREKVAKALDPTTARTFVADAPNGIDRYLVVGDVDGSDKASPWRAPLGGLSGARSANGYDSLAPQQYLDALGMDFYGQITDPECLVTRASGQAVLDMLRVTSVLAKDGTRASQQLQQRGPGTPIEGHWIRYDRVPSLPDTFAVSLETAAAVNAIRGPLACGALDLSTAQPLPPSVRHEADRIYVDANVSRPGLVVISEAFASGWRALVDGRSSAVQHVGPFLAVPVSAGAHRIELSYEIEGLIGGLLVSVVTLLALVGALYVRRRAGARRLPTAVKPTATPESAAPTP